MHKLNIKTTQLAFETLCTVLTVIFSVVVDYFNFLLFRPGIAPFRHYLQAYNPLPPPHSQTNELYYAVSSRFLEAEISAALKRTNKNYGALIRPSLFGMFFASLTISVCVGNFVSPHLPENISPRFKFVLI
jgi:hypothetical protein